MEKYEIHNREKMLKAMAVCAGPDCGVQCPYHGKSVGTKTCRTLLLEEAMAALVKDKGDIDDLEAAANTFREERDGLKEYALVLEKEGQEARACGDKLREECERLAADLEKEIEGRRSVEAHRDAIAADQAALHAENKALREKMEVLRDTNRSLDRELCRLQHDMLKGETDRPSVKDKELMAEVCKMICEAKYQEGRADALAEIVERCSFGGGGRHE